MKDTNLQPRMSLYSSAWCGYCRYVMGHIDQLGVDVEIRDTRRHLDHARDLIAATGRRTVPVLRITHPDGRDEWMPESREIVRYLSERFGQAA